MHKFQPILTATLVAFASLITSRAQQLPSAVPFINQPLAPTAVSPGGPGFILTVNGTGFVPGSTVDWNGAPRATTYASPSQLTAAILPSDIPSASTAIVTVVNPEPNAGTVSNAVPLTVGPPNASASFVIEAGSQGLGGGFTIAADFNGDGKPDVSFTHGGNLLGLALGNGDGTFQRTQWFPGGLLGQSDFPAMTAVGDFNGDGKLDIASANQYYASYRNVLAIILGNGDGTFQAPIEFTQPTEGSSDEITGIAVADLNGDGKLDVAIAYLGSLSYISIWLGNGDGTFQQLTTINSQYGGGGVLAVGDLNGDGKLDLVNVDGRVAQVFLGNGDGTFQSPLTPTTGFYPSGVAIADLNGDGKLDLAITAQCGEDPTCQSEGTISVLLGNGDGTFQPPADYNAGFSPQFVIAVDINNDGKVDLVDASICGAFGGNNCAQTGWDNLSVLLGNGDGTFQPEIVPQYGLSGYFYPLVAADFNADSLLDLAGGAGGLLLQTTLGLSNTSLSFSSQGVGNTSPPQPSTLTNVATQNSLAISNTQVTGANPTDFPSSTNCPPSLAATQQCQVNTVFAPTAPGPRSATVTITDSAVGSPHMIALTGTGIAGAIASLSSSALTFASQAVPTTSPIQTVTLTNTGTATLTTSSIAASAQFLARNTCETSLAPAAHCTISVAFKPSAGGTQTGTLTVSDNAPGSPQTVTLTGSGIFFSLSSPSLSFGTQTQGTSSQPQTLTLTNLANVAGPFTGVRFSGVNPSSFTQTDNCGATIAAHGSCTINVTFTPKKKGSLDATLQVGAGGTSLNATLDGTGN